MNNDIYKPLAEDEPRTYMLFPQADVETLTYSRLLNGANYRGRFMLVKEQRRFTFVQDPRRGPRNKVLKRTDHLSLLVDSDGHYSGRLHFRTGEKNIKNYLIAEVREIALAAAEWEKKQLPATKNTPKQKSNN